MDRRTADVHSDYLRCRCARSTSGRYSFPEHNPSWCQLCYFRDVFVQCWLHAGRRHDDRMHRRQWEHRKVERRRAVLPVKTVP